MYLHKLSRAWATRYIKKKKIKAINLYLFACIIQLVQHLETKPSCAEKFNIQFKVQ